MSFLGPLQRLLDACVEEASLSVVGRFALRWDMARFLTNLLQMREAERCAPAITQQRIERPIFITGLPRSGTTFLHRLMLADRENRAPLVWQTIYPYPLRDGVDRRVRAAGPAVPWVASAGRDFAAGMQRDHRACVP
jgi:hypothetical protein